MSGSEKDQREYKPLGFLLATILWTFIFWISITLFGLSPWQGLGQFLFIAGGLGPIIMGAVYASRLDGENSLQSLLIRCIDPSRGHWSSWMIALLLTPAIVIASYAISNLVASYSVSLSDMMIALRPDPRAVTTIAFFILFFGPVTEEVGWRGYGLDALQARFGPFFSSVVLAMAWCAWHVPLLFMDGFYDRFGYRPDPILFCWNLTLTTFIITWLYNRASRSILIVMVYHFMVNLMAEIVPGNYLSNRMATALTTIVVIGIVAKWSVDHWRKRSVTNASETR